MKAVICTYFQKFFNPFFQIQKLIVGVGKDESETPFMSYPLEYDHSIRYVAFASWAENTNQYIFDSGI